MYYRILTTIYSNYDTTKQPCIYFHYSTSLIYKNKQQQQKKRLSTVLSRIPSGEKQKHVRTRRGGGEKRKKKKSDFFFWWDVFFPSFFPSFSSHSLLPFFPFSLFFSFCVLFV